jgi:hypothetical protein
MVQNLVDVVERVFFVDNGVEKNSESPDILLLPSIRFSLKDLGSRII